MLRFILVFRDFFFFFENARLTLVQSLFNRNHYAWRISLYSIRNVKINLREIRATDNLEAAKFLASIRCFASGLFNRLPIAYLTIIVLYIPDTNRIDPANLNGIF